MDVFCVELAKVAKEEVATEIVANRNQDLVEVYIKNRSYIPVFIGLAAFFFLSLLLKRGRKAAEHFLLQVRGLSKHYMEEYYGILELAKAVLSDVEPNTEVDLAVLYKGIADTWCQKYKSLPGLGLLTQIDYTSFFDIVVTRIDLAAIRPSKRQMKLTGDQKSFICDEVFTSIRIVSSSGIWRKYSNYAAAISEVVFRNCFDPLSNKLEKLEEIRDRVAE